MTMDSDCLLRAGDTVIFIDRKEREYVRTLRPGTRVHIRDGTMQADDLIGLDEGSTVRNTAGERFLMVRPTFANLIPNLPRRAQVIYPKDIGPILLWGDIAPGSRVVEIGTGPGALTMALLRAVGPDGVVVSYEARPEFIQMARNNISQFHGEAPNWVPKLADATLGIEERGFDRMVMDLAEPWTLLPAAREVLRPGGVLVAYVPTVLQVKQFVDEARVSGFGALQTIETLLRFWHVSGLSVRPEHRMVAHTGFVCVARRLAGGPIERPSVAFDNRSHALGREPADPEEHNSHASTGLRTDGEPND
jgi:tRNA (adenine57-N1/adenine58-N1)-methyltransferase catalytic subunit